MVCWYQYQSSAQIASHLEQTVRFIQLLNTHDRVRQLRLNHVVDIFNVISAPYLANYIFRAAGAHTLLDLVVSIPLFLES